MGDRALSPAAPMRSSKVAPQAEAAATEAAPESKLPRAPLLRRLGEIDATIAHIKLPDGLDGYKTLPLHTAASRGDFREVAALLPTHGLSLTLRDEAGWMPVHHAACAGRRAIYRVPLHQVRAPTTSASLSPSLAQRRLCQIKYVRHAIAHPPPNPLCPCLSGEDGRPVRTRAHRGGDS